MLLPTVAAGFIALIALCTLWRLHDGRRDKSAWQELLAVAGPPEGTFDPAVIRHLPEPAQRYFLYTIAPGTPLYRAVEIEMRGELGLGSRDRPGYRPMAAKQILAPPHGLVWRVKAGAISGSDGVMPDTSWTRFWLYGIAPVVRAGGTRDHYRSAYGRVVSEGALWMPSSLLPGENVCWAAVDESTSRATVRYGKHRQAVDVSVAEDGRPTRVVIQRWSNANPEKTFREQPFGGYLSQFKNFNGYRLPTRVEGGNMIGTSDYFPFYRAELTDIRLVNKA